MRRAALTLFSTALMLVCVPRPAAAWWEFLEELSGPGTWKGFDIDARLFCLVDPLPADTEQALRQSMAMLANKPRPRLMVVDDARDDQKKRAVLLEQARVFVSGWKTTLDEWEDIFDRWQLAAGRSVDKISAVRTALASIRRRADSSLAAVIPATEAWFASPDARANLDAALNNAEREAGTAFVALQRTAETMNDIVGAPRFAPAALPGVIYSACNLHRNERRRAAFDVGMRFLWTNDKRFAGSRVSTADGEEFVGGERISLTTIEPAFAWNVFSNTKYDVVEYGLGAGFYWISSRAFPSVTGGFLEPVRLDFHFPSNFVKTDALPRKIIRSLVFRTGYLVFPGGFEPAAFAADPLDPVTNRRIGRDWVRYYGIYVDTEVFKKKAS